MSGTTPRNEAVELLRAILLVLENQERRLAVIERALVGPDVAPARELDSQYGDPVIKKDPKGWRGPSFQGKRLSQTTPEYLDTLAELKDWMAEQETKKGTPEGDKYAAFSRKDAARARGWAKRLRDGWKPPKEPRDAREPEPEQESDLQF